ncbi:hypothetical protein V5O48_004718 [Marasmius crinis-equi]|uniref:F-box domain-containing protein n=1 Tax=Marasmius crinis-equi TaxID=585013 RepID=A0ABR3FPE0_9AGAR
MSDTRRQSSRIKALPQMNLKDDSYEDIVHTTARKNLKRVRDEESFRVGNDEPPKKKQTKPGASGQLSLLPTMPLDVLYAIFSYLPPKSLLDLTNVNHTFRETLLSPDTSFVWTRIRKSCKAPDPFDGMSEIEWVRLLFGGHHCQRATQSCGAKGVPEIKWMLHQRICLACVKNNGVSKGKFKQEYPGEDKGVLDLVKPTDGGRVTGHTDYYSRKEIEDVLERMKGCKNKAELEKYTKERQDYLEKLEAHAKLCHQWVYEDFDRQVNDAINVTKARIEAVKTRLRALEYTDDDIQCIENLPVVRKDRPLTDRAWALMKNEVIEAVLDHRINRLLLSDPKADFVVARCDLITKAFYRYKCTLPPAKWREVPLPSMEATWLLPSMRAVITLPDDAVVTEETLAGPAESLEREIEQLMSILKSVISTRHLDWASVNDKNPLWRDSATVQMKCRGCHAVLSSVLTLVRHITGPCFLKSQMRISRNLFEGPLRMFAFFRSKAAQDLVYASSMSTTKQEKDSATGTKEASALCTTHADEMDERGMFFRCLECPGEYHNKAWVGTWRECIVHAFEAKHEKNIGGQGPEDPVFELVPVDEAKQPKDSRKCWACAHCTANAEELWTREVIIGHLRDVHKILEAHVPQDFFYMACDEAVAATDSESELDSGGVNSNIEIDDGGGV